MNCILLTTKNNRESLYCNDSGFKPINKFKQRKLSLDTFSKKIQKEVSFNGLSRSLGKRAFEYVSEILELRAKYPKANGWVGSMPREWLEKISKHKRKSEIKNFYAQLGKIVSKLRNADQNAESVNAASAQINDLFRRAEILAPNKNVNLKSLGSGKFGTAYLLDGTQYVIKIFHHPTCADNLSGNRIEANRAIYCRNNADNAVRIINPEGENRNELAKFYFADIDNGYIISEYIHNCKKSTKRETNFDLIGLEPTDFEEGRNRQCGYIYDYGEFKISQPILAKNKTARYIYTKIYKAPTEKRVQLWHEIYSKKKKSNDILIGLVEPLKLIASEKVRTNLFIKMAKHSDNTVKEALAYNLYCLPEEKRAEWFEKLADGADNIVKEALAHKLDCLHEDRRKEWFEKLAERADDSVKRVLASNLKCLPKNKRLEWFEKLADGANNTVKEALAHNLYYVPEDERVNWFIKLAQGADNPIKNALAKQLYCIPKSQKEVCFVILEENADDVVKEALAYHLSFLPEKDKRIIWFVKLAKDANNFVKKVLAYALDCLPEERREEWFEKLLEGADNSAKKSLVRNLHSLPEDKRAGWFIKLAKEDTNNYLRGVLDNELYYMPEKDKEECRKTSAVFGHIL